MLVLWRVGRRQLAESVERLALTLLRRRYGGVIALTGRPEAERCPARSARIVHRRGYGRSTALRILFFHRAANALQVITEGVGWIGRAFLQVIVKLKLLSERRAVMY